MPQRWLIWLILAVLLALIPLPRLWAQQSAATDQEFTALLAKDDAAMADVHRWFNDNLDTIKNQAGQRTTLARLIQQRLAPVRASYEDFLARHPEHTRARNAFASFLGQTRNEKEAASQWEIALNLDPKSAAAWNNLGVHAGNLALQLKQAGSAQRAIASYAKAVEVAPREPLYLHNLATAIALFGDAAAAHFQIDRARVLDRALEFYQKALDLDPKRFQLASELAETYHDIRPIRLVEARQAWVRAFQIARDDSDREWVNLQLALLEANAGDRVAARQQLAKSAGRHYPELHRRLAKVLDIPVAATPLPQLPPFELKVDLRRPDDRATMAVTADRLVIEISTRSGIGAATVKKISGAWPATVCLRINRSVLESFSVGNGVIAINGAAYAEQKTGRWHLAKGKETEGDPLPAESPLQLRVQRHGTDGMEFDLPKGIFTDKTDTLTLRWIDRYR